MIAHELMHWKRKDPWVNGWMGVVAAIHWFNPLVWMAMRRIRQDQEAACDAGVLSLYPGEQLPYGRTLVRLMELRASPAVRWVGAPFHGAAHPVRKRLEHIVRYREPSKGYISLVCLIAVFLTAVAFTNVTAANGGTMAVPPALSGDLGLVEGNRGEDADGELRWLRPADGKVTSPFGYRLHPPTGEKVFHDGIDIAGKAGTPVVAAERGEVTSAGWNSEEGLAVTIQHRDGYETRYAHLESVHVSAGDLVERGETIAAMGSTGKSTGTHLHFGVRWHGEPADPAGLPI